MTLSFPLQCKKHFSGFLQISFLLLLMATPALSKSLATEEWQITADKISHLEEPQSIIAEGNIILEKIRKTPHKARQKDHLKPWKDLLGKNYIPAKATPAEVTSSTGIETHKEVTIKADWINYDVVNKVIQAKGNIAIENEDDILTADEAQISLNQETGSFTGARIYSKKQEIHFEGEKIEKTGLNTYHIVDGWVVTCKVEEGETPPWSVASSSATIQPDGYASLYNARFNIHGFPVFYSPYLLLPVKYTRQTGFLFPEFSNSTWNGFGINFPFFFNVSESSDITLYPEYLTNRGFMPGVELRYINSVDNKATFMANYLKDDLSDPSETSYYEDTDYTHTNDDRYWIRGKLDHDFGSNLITRLDVDVVSDRDYLKEFDDGLTGYNASSAAFQETFGRSFQAKSYDRRENSLKLMKSWTGVDLNLGALVVNDVRVDEDESPTPLWKLPSLDFSGTLPLSGLGFMFDWNSEYVNYWREDGVGAHRFDVYPRISTPIPLSRYFTARVQAGARNTFYMVEEYGDTSWDTEDTPNRFLYDLFAELDTTVVKDFSLDSENYDYLSHEFRPFVEYYWVPEVHQDNALPEMDDVDTIEEEHKITYGFDNFFDFIGGEKGFRELGYIRAEQSYYFDSENYDEDQPFSDVNVEIGFRYSPKFSFKYETDIDVYGDNFVTHSFSGTYTTDEDDTISVEYSYDTDQEIEELNASLQTHLFDNWYFSGDVEHSFSERETVEAKGGLMYKADCWSAEFVTSYTPDDIRFMIMFNLAKIGSPFGFSL